MKKYILSVPSILFILLVFWGCEKEFDGVIDSTSSSFKVSNINSFSSFLYIVGDSLLPLRISFSNNDGVASVYANVFSSEGKKLNSTSVELLDNGKVENGDASANDKTYSALFPLSQSYPIGKYVIDYYVRDEQNTTLRVATHSFIYDNSQTNVPPVLSNLIAPDTVKLNTSEITPIFLSVTASDENGISDIKRVFFNSFIPPDGDPSNNNPFIMFDDGTNGDQTPFDGVYTLIIGLPATGVTLGTYRWEFEALDRTNVSSNKIIHNIVVQ